MENTTLWLKNIKSKECPKLEHDINVDVLIIGGGITGLSTAYHLKDSNLKIALVDKNLVAHGVSSRTTGKLTFLQELIYSKLNKKFSTEHVRMYLDSQISTIKMVKDIVETNNISCDFNEVDSYVFTDEEKEIVKIKKEKELLEQMGIEVNEYNDIPVQGIPAKYAISVGNTAVFHPVKYLLALKDICLNRGISIYENTNILDIIKKDSLYICKTPHGNIRCSKVALACHYPFFLLPLFFPLRGHLERSYLSASIVKNIKKFSAINTSVYSKSLRYHSDSKNSYFIYLNGSHIIEKNINGENNFNNLKKEVESLNLIPKYMWSNHDIITNDFLPYIGCVKSGDNTLLIGTGYNTWGMTNGSLAGKILSDMILEQENAYIPLFDPHRRKNIYNLVSIPANLYYSVKPFIENKLIKNKSWYSSDVVFKQIDGKSLAIYIDHNGKKHMVYNKCPHMKCNLVFNEPEKTWDCPCHGSRFSIDGECIQGPSNYNISYKSK